MSSPAHGVLRDVCVGPSGGLWTTDVASGRNYAYSDFGGMHKFDVSYIRPKGRALTPQTPPELSPGLVPWIRRKAEGFVAARPAPKPNPRARATKATTQQLAKPQSPALVSRVAPFEVAQCAREPRAVLAWYTCEGHLHHLIGETLWPIYNRGMRNASVVIASNEVWPTAEALKTDGCKGERYWSVAGLMAREHVHTADGSAFSLRTGVRTPLERCRCYAEAHVTLPSRPPSAEFYRAVARRSGVCERPARRLALVLQRSGTRRIVNAEELMAKLRGSWEMEVKPISFEGMTPLQQLEAACGATAMVGVHGQGMEWAHFLDGGRRRETFMLEVGFTGWPCLFTQIFTRIGKRAVCVQGRRAGRKKDPKSDDVVVDLMSVPPYPAAEAGA